MKGQTEGRFLGRGRGGGRRAAGAKAEGLSHQGGGRREGKGGQRGWGQGGGLPSIRDVDGSNPYVSIVHTEFGIQAPTFLATTVTNTKCGCLCNAA